LPDLLRSAARDSTLSGGRPKRPLPEKDRRLLAQIRRALKQRPSQLAGPLMDILAEPIAELVAQLHSSQKGGRS
jgi:hypothetical protein